MGGCVSTQDFDVETDGRKFRLKRVVASGGFSQIYLADDAASGEKFAVKKVVCHGRSEMERTRREINLLNRFGNFPHILPLVAVSEERSADPNVSTFCMVFPFCRFGSLQDELGQRRQTQNWLSRRRVLFLFRQICSAIELLHSAKPPVAHRDLKPANLMFNDEGRTLQLIDFGSATECPLRIEDAQQSRRMLDEAAELCTMPYRAPELFTCEIGTQIDESVDIWSLGCILYALCYFASPFDEVHERGDSVALAVQSAKVNFNKSAPFDQELTEMITSMIQSEPGKRPKISEVRKRAEEMRL